MSIRLNNLSSTEYKQECVQDFPPGEGGIRITAYNEDPKALNKITKNGGSAGGSTTDLVSIEYYRTYI